MYWLRRILLICVAFILILLLGGATVGWYIVFHDRGLNEDFDPAQVAASETRMWQAYYEGRGADLGVEMLVLMRTQFGASLKTAYEIVEPMALGAMTFGGNHGGDYRREVLPYLEDAYARLGKACGRNWDAYDLAKAELAWWVARRTPGQDSPAQVGELIAVLYGKLYGSRNPDIDRAAYLRAKAAQVRDQGGVNADWQRVENLLLESYTILRRGIQGDV